MHAPAPTDATAQLKTTLVLRVFKWIFASAKYRDERCRTADVFFEVVSRAANYPRGHQSALVRPLLPEVQHVCSGSQAVDMPNPAHRRLSDPKRTWLGTRKIVSL